MAANADSGAQLDVLSARERQVLEMASTGLTNGEVARELGVSVHAIKFHLARVYRKLGVANRTEATMMLYRALSLAAAVDSQKAS